VRPGLEQLEGRYDLIVIGGGITGAGIVREAIRSGASVLLVEARDFASGTSSWSSKLVHGGLRYLKEGQWRLTLESVRERKRLLEEAPGLVEPLRFLMPIRKRGRPGRWLMQVGLAVYDAMGGSRRSGWLGAADVSALLPELDAAQLLGAVHYEDAQTDDARLVLRLIFDACEAGAVALNYVHAEPYKRAGRVAGVSLCDALDGTHRNVEAGVVVNATGAWAGQFDPQGTAPPLRPLRGSHLVFPAQRFTLPAAVSWLHPRDRRPIFAYPWEGATVLGTTDLDHDQALDAPRIVSGEVEYLMEGLRSQFPRLELQAGDAVCSYSGVRPVVSSGRDDPSSESRESALWAQPGLIGITGGKLTTFRVTARQVLEAASRDVPALQPGRDAAVFESAVVAVSQQRLYGRLGVLGAGRLLQEMPGDELQCIGDTPYTWAELRWALRHERVVHLQDLMMRRTRLGLVSADGGAALLSRIETLCRAELGWDSARWQQEQRAYLDYWQLQHSPPR